MQSCDKLCSVQVGEGPLSGRFPKRDPKRHQWLEVNAYLSTDICGPSNRTNICNWPPLPDRVRVSIIWLHSHLLPQEKIRGA